MAHKFDFKAALDGADIVTDSGWKVTDWMYCSGAQRIMFCYDAGGVYCYGVVKTDGRPARPSDGQVSIFTEPRKMEGWINIYSYHPSNGNGLAEAKKIYKTEKDAIEGKNRSPNKKHIVATIKIEWEQ